MNTTVLQRIITGSILAVAFCGIYFLLPAWGLSCILLLLLGAILGYEWPAIAKDNALFWLITPLYPILPFAVLIVLNQQAAYRPLVFYLFILVPLFDTACYIFGKLWGRHKIMPRVSPGKSWQGFFGGWLSMCIALALIIKYNSASISFIALLSIASAISCLALLGDLLESWFKRHAGLKDSGTLLPGHGGLLDRFDSIMIVGIFFYLCKEYLLALLIQ